jgi:hypothetical protein
VKKQQNANYIVFGLTRPGLKLTIYGIRGEHINYYTTDVVKNPIKNKNTLLLSSDLIKKTKVQVLTFHLDHDET